jgi:type I restriction enzyme S subunit
MSDKQNPQRELEPTLRFPEFRGAGKWHTEPLRELATIIDERAGERSCTPLSITSGVGLVTQEEKFGRTIAGKQYRNYLVLQREDFAYNKSATKEYPQGFIAIYLGNEPAAVPNSIFTCFRAQQEKLAPAYLNYLFKNNLHGKWLSKYITVGARAHGSLNINDEDLLSLPVPRPDGPLSKAEQQKIAACLSSIDALISAEIEKLDALKEHKNGLLRQIFPVEGETVPRLRFPGFREAEAWDIKPLGELAENLDNRRIPVTESNRVRGQIPYYGASGIVDYINEFIFDEDLLCVSEDGANLVSRTSPIAFSIGGKSWVNNHAHVLRFASRWTREIAEDYLNSISLEDFLTGMAQPKLNRAMLDTIPIPIPADEKEQQAIADCLSSADELIRAQGQKLDALKVHRKGLMQQLFPMLDFYPFNPALLPETPQ